MNRETLHLVLEGARQMLPNATFNAYRAPGAWELHVTVKDKPGVYTYVFFDHANDVDNSPLGCLVDLMYSLPGEQQIPWYPLLKAKADKEAATHKVHLQIKSCLEDLRVEMAALRLDAEASKRERDFYKAKADL